ncbi:MAG: DUF4932 domain-containing protein [Chloroflexota bacterium]
MSRLHTILVGICIVALVAACQSTPSELPAADQHTESTATPRPESAIALPTTTDADTLSTPLQITVDPRLELISVIHELSESQGDIRLDSPYKEAIKDYFGDYSQHPSVTLFREILAGGSDTSAPFTLMLHLSDIPDLTFIAPLPTDTAEEFGGEEVVDLFIDHLRDFAEVTDFMAFFNAQEDFYDDLIASIKTTVVPSDIQALEEYYGTTPNSYTIAPIPLFGDGGFGPRVVHEDGTQDMYAIIRVASVEDDQFSFGTSSELRGWLWHEFSHSFVRPFSIRHADELDAYAMLGDAIAEQMQPSYTNWPVIMEEHVVRAVTNRLIYREIGQPAGDKEFQSQRNRGFIYIDAILEQLSIYEDSRDQYPTFAEFFPEIVATFERLAETTIPNYAYPSEWTINDILNNTQSATIIVPTNEDDLAEQSHVHQQASELQNEYNLDATILTDQRALQLDLSKQDLIVFGTMEGNLWLAEQQDLFPFTITAESITADTTYNGANLRLHTSWRNPQNPERAVAIFTAQQASDVSWSRWGDAADYAIFDGNTVLRKANYWKEDNVWMFGSP